MADITVFPVGSEVVIGGDIEGTIDSIQILECCTVHYRVVWWDNRTRKSEWFSEYEVDGYTKDKMRVGFYGQGGCQG